MHINQDQVPGSLREAIDLLIEGLDDADRDFIHGNPTFGAFGFGMAIRNSWGLWEPESHLVQWFKTNYKIAHADDISGIILKSFWAEVRGESFDAQAEADRYREHWITQGIDPLTGA